MRIVGLLLKLLLFVLLLGFAVKNTGAVTVRYFLGFEWQAPLVFVLLVVLALGAALGLLAAFGIVLRQRRELAALRAAAARAQVPEPAVRAVPPADPATGLYG
jgi:uncharacterized integral membrane protein